MAKARTFTIEGTVGRAHYFSWFYPSSPNWSSLNSNSLPICPGLKPRHHTSYQYSVLLCKISVCEKDFWKGSNIQTKTFTFKETKDILSLSKAMNAFSFFLYTLTAVFWPWLPKSFSERFSTTTVFKCLQPTVLSVATETP